MMEGIQIAELIEHIEVPENWPKRGIYHVKFVSDVKGQATYCGFNKTELLLYFGMNIVEICLVLGVI